MSYFTLGHNQQHNISKRIAILIGLKLTTSLLVIVITPESMTSSFLYLDMSIYLI